MSLNYFNTGAEAEGIEVTPPFVGFIDEAGKRTVLFSDKSGSVEKYKIEYDANKQNKIDEALLTSDKSIVGAINEVYNKIGQSPISDGPAPNEIWYTTIDGEVCPVSDVHGSEYDDNDSSNQKVISNVYKDGKGVITFSGRLRFIGTDGYLFNPFWLKDTLETVILPEGIQVLGSAAFSNRGESELVPLFYLTHLKSVYIPNTVKKIGYGAFEECTSLQSIYLPSSIESIDNTAFRNCVIHKDNFINDSYVSNIPLAWHHLLPHYFSAIVWDDKFTDNLNNNFYFREGNFIKLVNTNSEVVIPENISIQERAIISNGDLVEKLTLSPGIISISDDAFDNIYLFEENFINNSGLTSDYDWGINFLVKYIYTTTDGNPLEIEDYYLQEIIRDNTYVENLGSFTATSNVSVGKFMGFANLQTLIVPRKVTDIESYAFNNCSSLTDITLPDSITYIGQNAFQDCDSLKEIIIPDSVQYIGEYTFAGCSSLTKAVIGNGVTSIGEGAFEGCSSLNSVTIGNNIAKIEYSAFANCGSLTSIVFNGTKEQWNKIELSSSWQGEYENESSISVIHCTDGDIYIGDDYIPQQCLQLDITADDVSGRQTNTTVYYTAITNGIDGNGNTLNGITITGTATSNEFEQNNSYTDTVERTITFEFMGVTATTTITQGVWVDQSCSVVLNDQWRMSETQSNPDSALYDGVYESFSNMGVDDSTATMYIDLIGYTEFDVYIRSNSESCCDYVTIYEPNSDIEKATTQNIQNSGQDIDSYTRVHYDNLTGADRITVTYRKDVSAASGDDQGYVLIPKQ